MKKIFILAISIALLSCLLNSAAFAEFGYEQTKDALSADEVFGTAEYCGKPFGDYKDRIEEVLEKEKINDNYCIVYIKLPVYDYEEYAMLVGKNEYDEEEMVVWMNDEGVGRSLQRYVYMLYAYDLFSIPNEKNTLIVVSDDGKSKTIADNSLDASFQYKALMQAIKNVIG